ncbi:hypothetical protein KJ785_01355 [Patescibacteria group bacterium]|nr:hypothetical protein [Patescibacteria group bacterium]
MGKYLVPIGAAWVGLSLVVGLVVMFGANNNMSVLGEKEVVKEYHYTIVKPAEEDGNSGATTGVAEVNITGTQDYVGEEDLQAKVEVK